MGESVQYLRMNHQKEGAARKIFYLCERRDRHTNILNDEGRNVGPIKAKDQGVIPPSSDGLIFSNVSKN